MLHLTMLDDVGPTMLASFEQPFIHYTKQTWLTDYQLMYKEKHDKNMTAF